MKPTTSLIALASASLAFANHLKITCPPLKADEILSIPGNFSLGSGAYSIPACKVFIGSYMDGKIYALEDEVNTTTKPVTIPGYTDNPEYELISTTFGKLTGHMYFSFDRISTPENQSSQNFSNALIRYNPIENKVEYAMSPNKAFHHFFGQTISGHFTAVTEGPDESVFMLSPDSSLILRTKSRCATADGVGEDLEIFYNPVQKSFDDGDEPTPEFASLVLAKNHLLASSGKENSFLVFDTKGGVPKHDFSPTRLSPQKQPDGYNMSCQSLYLPQRYKGRTVLCVDPDFSTGENKAGGILMYKFDKAYTYVDYLGHLDNLFPEVPGGKLMAVFDVEGGGVYALLGGQEIPNKGVMLKDITTNLDNIAHQKGTGQLKDPVKSEIGLF